MLYGGTALALRTGSRESEDFDFFTSDPVDAHTLASTVSWLRDAELVQAAPSTATFLVDRKGRVKISFFGGLGLTIGRVGDVSEAVDAGVRAARALYPEFAPFVTIKALSYFGDGDLDGLPDDVKAALARTAQAVRAVERVDVLSATLA